MDLTVAKSRVIECREKTWAAGAKPQATIDGAWFFRISGDGWVYTDEWRGEQNPLGVESYIDSQVNWGMIYACKSENYIPELSEFLREMLMLHSHRARLGYPKAIVERREGACYFSNPEPLFREPSFADFASVDIAQVGKAKATIRCIGGLIK